jgi:hypothetical protein
LTPIEELSAALIGGQRAIVISEKEVDLRPQAPENRLFLLKMAEGSLAAGGRGGGFGERRVVQVALYQRTADSWSKPFESPDESRAAEFEVPYHVSRLPLTLADGTESMGYGVVDPPLVQEMWEKAKSQSSA